MTTTTNRRGAHDPLLELEQALNTTASMIKHLERTAVCARYAAERAKNVGMPPASVQVLAYVENDVRLIRDRVLAEQAALTRALEEQS